ncbi:MAG TPA: hypothetical protein VGX16_07785, partial [Solirubrobacteraceae bacterium]|nr:hypothetical protein [Solirubrobacteraceae bacterium]
MRARAGRLPPAAVRVPPAAALLALLLGLWLLWRPPSPDLAGQVHRLDLFNAHGLALWDSGWYGGHYLLGYSLLFPPLAGLLGIHGLGVLAVLASTAIFARLARLAFGSRAPLATALFALGAAGDLYIGRLTFALGVTLALAAVLAAATAADPPATHTTTRARSRAASPPTTPAGSRARLGLTALLSLACAAASPVAALFLALAALADLLANRRPARALALGVPGLLLVLLLAALFPEGGTESFGVTSLLAAAGLSGVVLLLLPARERLLRTGIALYLVALALAYLIPSPVGSNAVRLGVLFAAPILVGC